MFTKLKFNIQIHRFFISRFSSSDSFIHPSISRNVSSLVCLCFCCRAIFFMSFKRKFNSVQSQNDAEDKKMVTTMMMMEKNE